MQHIIFTALNLILMIIKGSSDSEVDILRIELLLANSNALYTALKRGL